MAIATTIENILNTGEGVLNNVKRSMGNESPATMDDIETIPVMIKTIRKTAILAIVSSGCNASRTPNAEATPFPPRKPANRGNICPVIAIIPATIIRVVSDEVPSSVAPRNTGSIVASQPLARSKIRTGMPVFQPRTLIVFVAPAFPLPCSLTSMPWNALPTHTAVGIDPRM